MARPNIWNDAIVVEVPLQCCPDPKCRSLKYIPVYGFRDSDGTGDSQRVCRACSLRYIIRTVVPDFGETDYEVS